MVFYRFVLPLFLIVLTASCGDESPSSSALHHSYTAELAELADEVRSETLRSWMAYKEYAWGHDVLAPISRTHRDWYEESLYISPIDAYSTLVLMGFDEEATEVEQYVVDSLSFDKDVDVKIFEVNIRILGGLLSMYSHCKNPMVLEKAQDFADRMLPAFNTSTGIPRYWVNLRTGESRGDTVNVAEAASYTFEMGVLSHFTGDPKYYETGKKATRAVFDRRSDLGLIGEIIDVSSGDWVSSQSHICAGVDSYYEYLLKSWVLFQDEELKAIWDVSLPVVHEYLADEFEGQLWYGRSEMETGAHVSSMVTLYDAFFPAMLALSGNIEQAVRLQSTWASLWNKYGLEPMVYDYRTGSPGYPVYDLNPEIMESAYYLSRITGDSKFIDMNKGFWEDLKTHCRTEIAFASVENVETMEPRDYMPTFFFAETLKYLYLTFSPELLEVHLEDCVFTTEAHPFKKKDFKDFRFSSN
jgi:mannosidase alpha-like ER degradation enhancer 1/mannosidase alpha-like ER degradation enhancer 2